MFSFLLILMITDVIEAHGFSHCCTCFTVIFLLLCFCSNHKNTLRNHFRLDNLVFFGQAWSFFLWVGLVEWVRWDVRACIWSFFYFMLGFEKLVRYTKSAIITKIAWVCKSFVLFYGLVSIYPGVSVWNFFHFTPGV